MFSKEAIQELSQAQAIAAASTAVNEAISEHVGRGIVALPVDFTNHDLEKVLPLRRRARGVMTTSVISSFAQYVQDHKEEGASVFIDQNAMTATAVLNLGTPLEPGHADNLAKMEAKRMAAFAALLQTATGSALSQTKAAEFFEDWSGHLLFFKDGSERVPPGRAIAAVRKLTIEALRKLESTEQQLSASRSSFESVSATSSDPLPTTIYFTCEPYHGLKSREFVMRLGVFTGGKDPAILLRIVNKEKHEEEMAVELAELVTGSLSASGLPVVIGKYHPAA
ncbi:MAG: DUF2303 family protein [Ramlibacter sp.]|nr:DUF2303 family protein [Ramlibacter sp.]